MKLLILGGTRFVGRYLVEAALDHGHTVTLFNRGKSNPELFPQVERLYGDRAKSLDALKGREWDAVIDTCGYTSNHVQATAQLLANAVKHYTFISSVSVYRNFTAAGQDESAPVATLPEGSSEDENDAATYGARKALCEQATQRAMSGRVLIIRPGIIVGPHDTIGRFTSWVRRVARGGEVLAPAPPDAVVQMIDVRDLAAWTLRTIEAGVDGIYNVAGPAAPLTFGQMLEQCKAASGADARFIWCDEEFLLFRGVKPFTDLPFWIPRSSMTHTGFFAINCQKVIAAGLKCRNLVETARDILASYSDASNTLNQPTRSGLAPEREIELLQMRTSH